MAISVSGPVTRVTDEFTARAIPHLRAATAQRSAALAVTTG
jgi:IclR family acetate operon transcriptional repressor